MMKTIDVSAYYDEQSEDLVPVTLTREDAESITSCFKPMHVLRAVIRNTLDIPLRMTLLAGKSTIRLDDLFLNAEDRGKVVECVRDGCIPGKDSGLLSRLSGSAELTGVDLRRMKELLMARAMRESRPGLGVSAYGSYSSWIDMTMTSMRARNDFEQIVLHLEPEVAEEAAGILRKAADAETNAKLRAGETAAAGKLEDAARNYKKTAVCLSDLFPETDDQLSVIRMSVVGLDEDSLYLTEALLNDDYLSASDLKRLLAIVGKPQTAPADTAKYVSCIKNALDKAERNAQA